MSSRIRRENHQVYALLKQRFPKAFPDYDHIIPLKTAIEDDILTRLVETGDSVDRTVLKRFLTVYRTWAGYRLAVLYHRGDRCYDLDGQPVETIDEAARAAAAQQLDTMRQRQQTHAVRYQTHKQRERQLQVAKAERQAERDRKAALKQQRREEHERNRQRKLAQQAQPAEAQPSLQGQAALLSPRDPSQPRSPTVTYKKKRRQYPEPKR